MSAGPPARLRDELLRRRRLVVRADLVIWHPTPNLAAEARGTTSSITANHAAAARDETDRSRGKLLLSSPWHGRAGEPDTSGRFAAGILRGFDSRRLHSRVS